jgi:hypothetical protein
LKIKDFSSILELLDEESDVEMSQKELEDFKKEQEKQVKVFKL